MRDLSKYEVVEGKCDDCEIRKEPYTCPESCQAVYRFATGEYCGVAIPPKHKILKKKEVWVQCTKENTKVGDIVRWCFDGDHLRTVDYVFRTKKDFIISSQVPGSYSEGRFCMDDYEVQIKE